MDAITELAGAAMGGVQEAMCDECDGHGELPVETDIGEQMVGCSRCFGSGVRPKAQPPKAEPLAILGPGGDYTTEIKE